MNDEKPQWIPFVLLCLASLFGVVLIGELANPPERTPPAPDDSAERLAAALKSAHTRATIVVDAAVASSLEATDDYIETRRETVSAAGAEILLPRSHTRLAHALVQREEGPWLVIVHRSLSSEEAPIVVEIFRRRGGLWSALESPFREELPFEGVIASGDVRLHDLDPDATEPSFSGAVLPIHMPASDGCDDGRGTQRTHHLMLLGSRPRFALSHISSGTRWSGERRDYARLELLWNARGDGGEAVFAVAERPVGPRVTLFRYPFTFSEGGFSIRNGIANLFNEEVGAANTLRNREGSGSAQHLYRQIVMGLELIGPIEGPMPFCVELPHRARRARTINAINWRNQLDARIFQARLPIATYLAEEGDGPRALAMLELDPALAQRRLGDTDEGERLLFILTHPSANTRLSLQLPRNFGNVELAERVSAVTSSLHDLEKPLVWDGNDDLLIPRKPDPAAAAREASRRLSAYHMLHAASPERLLRAEVADTLGALAVTRDALADGARVQSAIDAIETLQKAPGFAATQPRILGPPLPFAVAADAFAHGALQSMHAQDLARTHAASFLVGARSWALDRAEAAGDYIGPRIFSLNDAGLRPTPASPEAMRRYVPLQRPYDQSPLGIHLLLDYTWDCRGLSLLLCEPSNPQLCRDTAALGLVPGDWAGNAQVAREDIHLHLRRVSLDGLCAEGQRAQNASVRLEPLGWYDDNHLVFLLNERHVAIHVPDNPKAPLARVQLALDPQDLRWFWPFGGPDRRYRLFLDDYALWVYDRQRERYFIVAWSDSSGLTIANASRPWRTALAPDGRSLAIWQIDVGLSIGSVYGLR